MTIRQEKPTKFSLRKKKTDRIETAKTTFVDNKDKEKKFEELMMLVVKISRRQCGPVRGDRGYNKPGMR